MASDAPIAAPKRAVKPAASTETPVVGRALKSALTLVSVLALCASALHYRTDSAGRDRANDFARKYQLAIRRPAIAQTLQYAPSADWTAGIVADVTLRDTFDAVDLTNASAANREAWIANARTMDDELRDSQSLLLTSVAARPGWPFYQSVLGQTTFALLSRSLDPDLIARPELWRTPLLHAARAAVAATSVWHALAAMYLRTWPVLSATHESSADEVFKRTFREPYFVITAFGDAARLLGVDRVMGYVSDDPISLRSVAEQLSAANDATRAWRVAKRWEQREWQARVRDFAEVQREFARGDRDGVQVEAEKWLGRHSIWDFDSAAAHAQAIRLLEMWPVAQQRHWATDPLADVVRYVLSRSGGGRYRNALKLHLQSFDAVPRELVDLRGSSVSGPQGRICDGELHAPEGRVRFRLTTDTPVVADIQRNRARAATVFVPAATDVAMALLGEENMLTLRPWRTNARVCMDLTQ